MTIYFIAIKRHQLRRGIWHNFILELLKVCTNELENAARYAIIMRRSESFAQAELASPEFNCTYVWSTKSTQTKDNELWLLRTIEGKIYLGTSRFYHLANHFLLWNKDVHEIVFQITQLRNVGIGPNQNGISYELLVFNKNGHQVIAENGAYTPLSEECRLLFSRIFRTLHARMYFSSDL